MINGVTSSGFAFELDEKVINNMELVDALAECSTDNPFAISKTVKLLLGEELRQRLYDHLRTDDCRVPMEEVSKAVSEIFAAFGRNGKNC